MIEVFSYVPSRSVPPVIAGWAPGFAVLETIDAVLASVPQPGAPPSLAPPLGASTAPVAPPSVAPPSVASSFGRSTAARRATPSLAPPPLVAPDPAVELGLSALFSAPVQATTSRHSQKIGRVRCIGHICARHESVGYGMNMRGEGIGDGHPGPAARRSLRRRVASRQRARHGPARPRAPG